MVSWSVINAGDRCGDYGSWNYIFKKKRFSVGGVSMYIELKNVSKKIKGIDILDDVSLRMESGKIYGFRGKNGSGKTMLMRAIAGLIKVTGTVDINGKILGKDEMFPPSIGILIENPSFISNYTGFENLKTLASIRERIDDNKIRQTLTEVGLEPDDKRTFKKYSLGMKQRLGIAAAIMEDPDIIILDEPTAALDPIAEYEVYSKFNEIVQDKTAIYISHRLSSCRFCDVIAVFDGGQIVQRGVHDRLLQDTHGKYYELWNAQAQYYT